MKHMCSWKKKELNEKLESFKKIIKIPKFFCRKCGRVAKSDKYLCKPEKL